MKKNQVDSKKPQAFPFFVLICFGLFLMPTSTQAAASNCSYKEINRLQKIAANITYQYENDISNNFILTFKNVTEELYLKNEEGVSYYWDRVENNTQSVYIDGLEGGKTYIFRVYTYGDCEEEKIRTIYINLPKVNPYASRSECQGLTDFSLCKKWTNTENLSEETFLKRIEEYKNQQDQIKKDNEETPVTKKSKFNLLLKNYDLILVGIIFISLTIITILKLKERRERNKLL